MTIAALVTEGIGSYGDVAHVVTDGLDVGAVPSTNAIATILTEGFGMSATASAFVVTEGFGSSSTPTPTVPEQFSGGYYDPRPKRRTKDELADHRARYGIVEAAAEIINDVALRQTENQGLDAAQQLAELQGELEASGIQLESKHILVLETMRAQYRREAIEQQARMAEEQDIVFVMAMLSEIDDLH